MDSCEISEIIEAVSVMPVVAIVGSYFGDGSYEVIEKNVQIAESYAIVLANSGIGFFCPHLHTRHFEVKAEAKETFYHKLDFKFLTKMADALLAIPGWEKSSGSKREIVWARRVNIPIFYPKSPTDIDEIKKWNKKKIAELLRNRFK